MQLEDHLAACEALRKVVEREEEEGERLQPGACAKEDVGQVFDVVNQTCARVVATGGGNEAGRVEDAPKVDGSWDGRCNTSTRLFEVLHPINILKSYQES